MYIYIHIYIYAYIHVNIYTCVHRCIDTYIHIHIRTYIICYIMWEGVFLICEAPSSGRLLGCGHQNPSAFRLVSAVRDGPA